ncbi:Protein of unknown function [Pyronema omphalodes CBS 100304]|uniref:Uncharacterized protein n=1 Tax=Pyronema omphalodes (strain CBS 100304) TaxID=1076935 RepID=U4KZ81_PYROM|nr:Protein of unknown function [Pyronema omphalodes CBS 100304]
MFTECAHYAGPHGQYFRREACTVLLPNQRFLSCRDPLMELRLYSIANTTSPAQGFNQAELRQ